jgi:tRNA(fMet)-specific endonuclease VapC
MLIDTSIFIDFMKGSSSSINFLVANSELTTSQLVVMELIRGGNDKRKISIKNVEKMLDSLNVRIHPVEIKISDLSYKIFKDLYHKQGIGIADAFIAATALVNNEIFVTSNTKHFKNIKGLKVQKPY